VVAQDYNCWFILAMPIRYHKSLCWRRKHFRIIHALKVLHAQSRGTVDLVLLVVVKGGISTMVIALVSLNNLLQLLTNSVHLCLVQLIYIHPRH